MGRGGASPTIAPPRPRARGHPLHARSSRLAAGTPCPNLTMWDVSQGKESAGREKYAPRGISSCLLPTRVTRRWYGARRRCRPTGNGRPSTRTDSVSEGLLVGVVGIIRLAAVVVRRAALISIGRRLSSSSSAASSAPTAVSRGTKAARGLLRRLCPAGWSAAGSAGGSAIMTSASRDTSSAEGRATRADVPRRPRRTCARPRRTARWRPRVVEADLHQPAAVVTTPRVPRHGLDVDVARHRSHP